MSKAGSTRIVTASAALVALAVEHYQSMTLELTPESRSPYLKTLASDS